MRSSGLKCWRGDGAGLALFKSVCNGYSMEVSAGCNGGEGASPGHQSVVTCKVQIPLSVLLIHQIRVTERFCAPTVCQVRGCSSLGHCILGRAGRRAGSGVSGIC